MRIIVLALLVATNMAAGAASPATQPTKVSTQTLRQNRLALWRSSVTLPSSPMAAQDLRATITTLQMLSPSTRPAASMAPAPTPAPVASTPATAPAVAVEAEVPQTQPTTEPASPAVAGIDPRVLGQLKTAPAKGRWGALALADALFADGQPQTAFTLYEQAMTQALAPQDKAWALFQMGNCRMSSDANAAVVFYRRVASEHADSIWASVAVEQVKTIEWQRNVNPQAVLQALSSRNRTANPGADANAR